MCIELERVRKRKAWKEYIMERGKGDEACLLFWRENISLRLVALVSLYDSCFNQNRRVDRLSPV